LAVTLAFALRVNVQVLVLFPPLEQAPDQTTSRPFVALTEIVFAMTHGAVKQAALWATTRSSLASLLSRRRRRRASRNRRYWGSSPAR
jgi:hypothetical protein